MNALCLRALRVASASQHTKPHSSNPAFVGQSEQQNRRSISGVARHFALLQPMGNGALYTLW